MTDNESEMYSTSPLLEPDTCLGSEDVDQTKCLTIAELQHDFDLLHGVCLKSLSYNIPYANKYSLYKYVNIKYSIYKYVNI